MSILLSDVCKEFPDFNHLRMLKENFELVYDCVEKEDAEGVYREWLKLVPPSGKNQQKEWEKAYKVRAELFGNMRSFKNGVTRFYDEIFQFFEPGCRFTNAATEGLNNMIGAIERKGNGFSFEQLRAKALLLSQ